MQVQRAVISQAAFPGRGGCASCVPSALSALVPQSAACATTWLPDASGSSLGTVSVFSVMGSFPAGRNEDLLQYQAFSLASELFLALTDMKLTYQRGMTLLLSKKSGFHLSSERAVMMVGFFPITSLNFSCAEGSRVGLGTWQTTQQTAGGFVPLLSLAPVRLAYCS